MEVISIGNHRADKEELNLLIEEYQDMMREYREAAARVHEAQIGAQGSVATRTIETTEITIVDVIESAQDIQAIHTFWNGMVEADQSAKTGFLGTTAGLSEIKTIADTFLNGLGKNGRKIGSLDVDALQAAVFGDEDLMKHLTDKLARNEPLTEAERELLYQYIQSEVFNEEKHNEMRSLIQILGADTESLNDRLNDKVLATEADLMNEIAMIEMYLFSGNLSPEKHHVNDLEAAHLSSYLALLYNYQRSITEAKEIWDLDFGPNDPLYARIDGLEYELTGDPLAIRINSEIGISLFPDETGKWSRADFMAREDQIGVMTNESSVVYYPGFTGSNALQREENLKLYEERATYTQDYIGKELAIKALEAATKGNPMTGVFLSIGEYQAGLDDLEEGMKVGEAKLVAMDLGMEMQISERHVPGTGPDQLEIKLVPTDVTHDKLDRWEEVVNLGHDIKYPSEEIKTQDWYQVSEFLHKNKENIQLADSEIYEYIFNGRLPEGKTIEDLVGAK